MGQVEYKYKYKYKYMPLVQVEARPGCNLLIASPSSPLSLSPTSYPVPLSTRCKTPNSEALYVQAPR